MKRLAYPTLPRLPNPAHSPQRTVRGLAAPCTPAGTGPGAGAQNKKAVQNGQPCYAKLRQAAIISAETPKTTIKETGP